jgi:hypothetical protein
MATNTPLQSIILTSATPNIIFSNIDQSYTDLIVIFNGSTSTGNDVGVYINGDTASNYSATRLYGSGSSVAADRGSNQTYHAITIGGPGNPGQSTFQVFNYSNSNTFKTTISRASNPSSSGYVGAISQLWRSTAPITSLNFFASGSTLFTAGTTFDLYGIKSGAPSALGGDIVTTDGNYWYHAFTASGTFTPQKGLSCDVLVVAGGGGGGRESDSNSTGAGGGGAGGLYYSTGNSVGTAQTVTVGGGGATGSNAGQQGSQGSNSVFGSLTAAVGGGFGGGTDSAVYSRNGGNGGSGGAGGSNGTSGTGTAGQGNNAGTVSNLNGAGGGGAGAVGGNASSTNGGNGGAGVNTYSAWLSATGLGVSGFIAGGGGGGYTNVTGGTTNGTGGSGGGGAGGNPAVAGTANTGGGGGGANNQGTNTQGGNGGSGLVIVRYPV